MSGSCVYFSVLCRWFGISLQFGLMAVIAVACLGEASITVPSGCEGCLVFASNASEEERLRLLEDSRCAAKDGASRTGVCVECRRDDHCGENKTCQRQSCVCKNDRGCPDNSYCNNGNCVECLTHEHCKGRAASFCIENRCSGLCEPGTTRPCSLPGECNAAETCSNAGIWRDCKSQGGTPEPERCDGIDNNCNGLIDEDFPNLGKTCKEQIGNCSVEGVWKCKPEGDSVYCDGPLLGAKPEECNGKDDDCNGKIDDNLTPPPCAKQQGVCKGSVKTCGGEKGWLECADEDYKRLNAAYNAKEDGESEDTCDGLDNNCNGEIDEGCFCKPGAKGSCGSDAGECRPGERVCNEDGKWGTCVGSIGPKEEICDGKDNNCNGQIDESDPELGKPCQAQAIGDCALGQKICINGKLACEPGRPKPEVCDNNDNDCDGKIDNIVGRQCDVPDELGECAKGEERCQQGKMICARVHTPRPEIKDGLDNDCNGFIDDGIIYTVVGTGKAGFSGDGGQPLKADINCPMGLAFDARGMLYFADSKNYRIRKVDFQNDSITTVAGFGVKSSNGDGGLAVKAAVTPFGLAFDQNGSTLYFTDQSANSIRSIDSQGTINTWLTQLNSEPSAPNNLVFDVGGAMFVTASNGLYLINTIGTPKATQLIKTTNELFGLAITKHAILWYTEPQNGHVYSLPVAQAIPGVEGIAEIVQNNTRFWGLALAPQDILYLVAQSGAVGGMAIEQYNPSISPQPNRVAGGSQIGFQGDDSLAAQAIFSQFKIMAFDSNGNLLIADCENHRIRMIKGPIF